MGLKRNSKELVQLDGVSGLMLGEVTVGPGHVEPWRTLAFTLTGMSNHWQV